MDNDQYQRLMLLATAEMLVILDQIAFPSPTKVFGSKAREIADIMRSEVRDWSRARQFADEMRTMEEAR